MRIAPGVPSKITPRVLQEFLPWFLLEFLLGFLFFNYSFWKFFWHPSRCFFRDSSQSSFWDSYKISEIFQEFYLAYLNEFFFFLQRLLEELILRYLQKFLLVSRHFWMHSGTIRGTQNSWRNPRNIFWVNISRNSDGNLGTNFWRNLIPNFLRNPARRIPPGINKWRNFGRNLLRKSWRNPGCNRLRISAETPWKIPEIAAWISARISEEILGETLEGIFWDNPEGVPGGILNETS